MLVLRRSCGQSIVIGKNAEIIVKILRNENGMVSIGVDAPAILQIDRLEIYEKKLNDLSISNDHKSCLYNRLKLFEKRLIKPCSSNDSLLTHDICSS